MPRALAPVGVAPPSRPGGRHVASHHGALPAWPATWRPLRWARDGAFSRRASQRATCATHEDDAPHAPRVVVEPAAAVGAPEGAAVQPRCGPGSCAAAAATGSRRRARRRGGGGAARAARRRTRPPTGRCCARCARRRRPPRERHRRSAPREPPAEQRLPRGVDGGRAEAAASRASMARSPRVPPRGTPSPRAPRCARPPAPSSPRPPCRSSAQRPARAARGRRRRSPTSALAPPRAWAWRRAAASTFLRPLAPHRLRHRLALRRRDPHLARLDGVLRATLLVGGLLAQVARRVRLARGLVALLARGGEGGGRLARSASRASSAAAPRRSPPRSSPAGREQLHLSSRSSRALACRGRATRTEGGAALRGGAPNSCRARRPPRAAAAARLRPLRRLRPPRRVRNPLLHRRRAPRPRSSAAACAVRRKLARALGDGRPRQGELVAQARPLHLRELRLSASRRGRPP